jgi:hypothetical protein
MDKWLRLLRLLLLPLPRPLPLLVVVRKRTQTNKARYNLLNASGVLATERARITKEISAAPTPNRRYKSVVIAQDLKRDFSALENGKKKTSIGGGGVGGRSTAAGLTRVHMLAANSLWTPPPLPSPTCVKLHFLPTNCFVFIKVRLQLFLLRLLLLLLLFGVCFLVINALQNFMISSSTILLVPLSHDWILRLFFSLPKTEKALRS